MASMNSGKRSVPRISHFLVSEPSFRRLEVSTVFAALGHFRGWFCWRHFFFRSQNGGCFLCSKKRWGKLHQPHQFHGFSLKKWPHRNKTQLSSYKKHKPNLHCINYYWYICILLSVLLTFWYGFSKQKKTSKTLMPQKIHALLYMKMHQAIHDFLKGSWNSIRCKQQWPAGARWMLRQFGGDPRSIRMSKRWTGWIGDGGWKDDLDGDLGVWWRFRMADG